MQFRLFEVLLQFNINIYFNIATNTINNWYTFNPILMKVAVFCYMLFVCFFYSKTCFAQAPNLGIAAGFVLFTSAGAVPNTSESEIIGDIGTNFGAISGFGSPSLVNGDLHTQNNVTEQAANDLLTAYNQLFNTPINMPGHAAAFGTETITAGVYGMPAAGSLGGNLTLDAEGNADAVFILKFGGAFTVGAGSTVILANGALAGNVFWVVEGAISMAANTIMKGTLIANNGANSLGANSNLEGRMYSTAGAVNTNTDAVTKPTAGGYVVLPIQLLSFSGVCYNQEIVLNWTTATEINNQYFTIENSVDGHKWDVITRITGAMHSATFRSYNYTDRFQQKENYYYRLKQTDLDGVCKIGPTIFIKNCEQSDTKKLLLYPNPTTGKFNLAYLGDRSKIKFTEIFNVLGEKVFEINGTQTQIDLTGRVPGLYYLCMHINASTPIRKVIILTDK